MNSEYSIAKKYAQAFINVFFEQMSDADAVPIADVITFLKKNSQLISFLKWPVMTTVDKVHCVRELFAKCKVREVYYALITVLVHDKKLFIIRYVLEALSELYNHKKGIIYADISSAHELSQADQRDIERFFNKLTDKDVKYAHTIDKRLIAGVRLQSKTLLWEYSIAKQLDHMKLLLVR